MSLAPPGSSSVAFHRSWTASALPRRSFRDPIPGPQPPLSTLRLTLSVRRMTRGRVERYLLPRRGTLTPLRHAGLTGAPRLALILPSPSMLEASHRLHVT